LTGGDPLSLVLTYCIEWQKEEEIMIKRAKQLQIQKRRNEKDRRLWELG
jgi:hypothetical protein